MTHPVNAKAARQPGLNQSSALAPASPALAGTASGRGRLAPFFETAANPSATRRMLLVFFDFAPSAEVGALRWLSMTRFGAERGWSVDVITMRPEYMGTLDESRLAQLPAGVRIFGFDGAPPAWYRGLIALWRRAHVVTGSRPAAPAPAPAMVGHLDGINLDNSLGTTHNGSAWRRAFRSRVHFGLADAFADRAVSLGVDLAARHRYDVIVSSGPPHAAHDAARIIAAQTGLPFVMDMRDPWSDDQAMPEEMRSQTWSKIAAAHERRCVEAARLVIVTSHAHAALQERKYGMLKGRVHTVMNGADRDPIPTSDPGERFVVGFAGMIYLGRNPRTLFRAAARVARETGASPAQFAVEFLGDEACEGVPLATIAAEEGLGAHFRSFPFRPRREAMAFLARASVLVSLPLRTAMTLPAKLFEYMRFDAWILALAERGSATAELLRDTDADVVSPDDVEGIAAALRRRYDEFCRGGRPVAINRDGRFDRATQAGHLYDALERLVDRTAPSLAER